MKTCLKCDRPNIRESNSYCPDCGSRELSTAVFTNGTPGLPPLPAGSREVGVLATPWQRVGAFSIDLCVFFVVSLFGNIPIIGAFIVIAYWLFRDYQGVSVGKRFMRLKVVNQSGGPATTQQCILRNVVFALPSLVMVVPGIGFIGTYGIDAILCVVELILVFATRSRLGDRMAGTAVIKS